MNKKKIAGLLLVGTLLIGGGALGAKAWFNSQVKVASNLQVTMGTLKLEATGDDVWTVENKTNGDPNMVTEITNPTENNNYTNVRPGDMFTKTVKLKNVGSLKSHVKIKTSQKQLPTELRGMVDWDLYINDQLTNGGPIDPEIDMNANEEVKLTLKIGLKGDGMENEFQGPGLGADNLGEKHQNLVDFLNSDVNFIDIEGTQVNAPR